MSTNLLFCMTTVMYSIVWLVVANQYIYIYIYIYIILANNVALKHNPGILNICQNHTICAQMLQESYVPLLWGASLGPTGAAEASKAPQGLILNELLLILGPFWLQFS